jgi:hypothetical protein
LPPDDYDFGASEKKTSADLGDKKAGGIFEPASPITVRGGGPGRKLVAVGLVVLAIGIVVAAVVGLTGGSDSATTSVASSPGPGPISKQSVPKPAKPRRHASIKHTTVVQHTEVQPAGGAPQVSGLSTADATEVRFVAEQWVNFAQTKNLGAFCIFLSEGFRGRLTGKSGVESLASCVQGDFAKLTLGSGLLPLTRISGHGHSARVVYGRGQVATLRKVGAGWKIDTFHR